MAKIYFNTRDELISVDLDLLAVVKADGNYSQAVYINKREITLTFPIMKVEEALLAHNGERYKFLRLGRSIIVNHKYLSKIDMAKQLLILSDGCKCDLRMYVPKKTLRLYKEAIVISKSRH